MRNHSIKLLLTENEKARLERRAKKAGFAGRGALVAYIRWREELPEVTAGAPIGNQNKRKKDNETTTMQPTTTRRAKSGKDKS